jgi:uncharacterized protein (TIGR03000 family)
VPEIESYTYSSGANQPQLATPESAGFIVRVPDPDAEIWFQDYKTHNRGRVRLFESDVLQAGITYPFRIRARWMQNGQPVEQTRAVPVRAGQQVIVDFQYARGPNSNPAAAKSPTP